MAPCLLRWDHVPSASRTTGRRGLLFGVPFAGKFPPAVRTPYQQCGVWYERLQIVKRPYNMSRPINRTNYGYQCVERPFNMSNYGYQRVEGHINMSGSDCYQCATWPFNMSITGG